MTNFNEGDRVRLLPFEGVPEQLGTVLGPEENGVYTVELDKEYRDLAAPDGLCEVTPEQMEAL